MQRHALFGSALLLGVLFFLSSASAQNGGALINEALDKQVTLQIDSTLPQAMQSIAKETGVRIEALPSVWETLPWGEQTTLKARIENQTLRQALEALSGKLGLQFVVQREVVELQPLPALSRLGRRATVQELAMLDALAAGPLKIEIDRPSVRQLLAAVDQHLQAAGDFVLEDRTGESFRGDQTVALPRGASPADALEALSRDTRATWYPWGNSILVVTDEELFRSLLERPLTLRYNGVDVAQVLTDLSMRAGVPFAIEPGALQRIPNESRIVRLLLDNVSVRQALEAICGFTGLGYVANEDGVYIWNETWGAGSGGRDRILGVLPLDNGMQLLMPASQVPADVQEYLQARAKREIERIRQMMREEGFAPATRPAANPSPDL